jgi:DNA-directed RNA polymerase specialized sigma subunit
MQNQMGRPPSSFELAGELKWPVSHVETMQKSLRRDLSPHVFQTDPVSIRTSRFEEVKALIPYELTAQENAVFELLMKSPDKPMSKLDIARRLNISPSRVSKINKKIADKMLQYGVE